jgi:hypothetical protein
LQRDRVDGSEDIFDRHGSINASVFPILHGPILPGTSRIGSSDDDPVSDRLISFLEACAFPPIRKKKANGWGTGLIQIHTVKDLV